jgi:AcrR family transcriptional regulator
MPKRVDHEVRRREIVDALCRIAARGGLSAATFREVAAEAGVSVRLVQYYFGTKADLLHAANRHVVAQAGERVARCVARVGPTAPPRRIVRALVREFLPLDDERRETMVLFHVFYAAQMTDPSLARGEGRGAPDALAALVARQIRRGQETGEVSPDVDADLEAVVLTTALPNFASAPIVGYVSLREATRALDRTIDRIFGGARGR